MSGPALSAEAIAALVDAAKEGRLPDEPESARRRRRSRVRTIDFTRPTKFSADQERRFKRSLDSFCGPDHRPGREEDMTRDEAILALAESTAEVVAPLLEKFAPGRVSAGGVAVAGPGDDPLDQIAAPAVATSVSYVDGVTGGNVFVITVEGARRLAAAMMGADPAEPAAGAVAELGRARLSGAEMVSLPAGAVVELDRQAEEPVDLYVNGKPFATGRLMVVNGTDWAVRIETVLDIA